MAANAYKTTLSRRVEALQAERGDSVKLSEVAGVVESLMTTMEGDISAIDIQMHRELQELADYIRRAKDEIAAIQPQEIPNQHISIATDELDAVVQATEQATGVILDAAEQLGDLAKKLEGDAAAQIDAITTRIYEASNFQDITGQRITKVVRTLHHIENKVTALARAFGHDMQASPAAGAVAKAAEGDLALLNGPQMPDKANSQADIDALLASFD
ncbi:MAG TPA: protein phosphatase CheZ [Candidatus Sulfotelmatobacter sp.]|nr:protein phosphatase CheZ [Candidatus Sulfotelmatobacter sp.]